MSSMNTTFINEHSPKNKPYDEEVWFEEAITEDVEITASPEDAYDDTFTNLITEQLKNQKYISN